MATEETETSYLAAPYEIRTRTCGSGGLPGTGARCWTSKPPGLISHPAASPHISSADPPLDPPSEPERGIISAATSATRVSLPLPARRDLATDILEAVGGLLYRSESEAQDPAHPPYGDAARVHTAHTGPPTAVWGAASAVFVEEYVYLPAEIYPHIYLLFNCCIYGPISINQ